MLRRNIVNKLKTIFFLILISLAPVQAEPVKVQSPQLNRVEKSQQVIKEFSGRLKAELKSAMMSGGPSKAIKVCKNSAPQIAQQLSQKYGWKISRTSLKTRNPKNSPDAWEVSILEKFEIRKNAGEEVQQLVYYSETINAGNKAFRYIQAIPTAKICLTCHGEHIAPQIKTQLKEEYPHDQASGFKLGDIRGAYSISQPVSF